MLVIFLFVGVIALLIGLHVSPAFAIAAVFLSPFATVIAVLVVATVHDMRETRRRDRLAKAAAARRAARRGV